MHNKQPLHFLWSIHALPFFQSIALLGHIAMHAPHEMHFFASTCGFFIDVINATGCGISEHPKNFLSFFGFAILD